MGDIVELDEPTRGKGMAELVVPVALVPPAGPEQGGSWRAELRQVHPPILAQTQQSTADQHRWGIASLL